MKSSFMNRDSRWDITFISLLLLGGFYLLFGAGVYSVDIFDGDEFSRFKNIARHLSTLEWKGTVGSLWGRPLSVSLDAILLIVNYDYSMIKAKNILLHILSVIVIVGSVYKICNDRHISALAGALYLSMWPVFYYLHAGKDFILLMFFQAIIVSHFLLSNRLFFKDITLALLLGIVIIIHPNILPFVGSFIILNSIASVKLVGLNTIFVKQMVRFLIVFSSPLLISELLLHSANLVGLIAISSDVSFVKSIFWHASLTNNIDKMPILFYLSGLYADTYLIYFLIVVSIIGCIIIDNFRVRVLGCSIGCAFFAYSIADVWHAYRNLMFLYIPLIFLFSVCLLYLKDNTATKSRLYLYMVGSICVVLIFKIISLKFDQQLLAPESRIFQKYGRYSVAVPKTERSLYQFNQRFFTTKSASDIDDLKHQMVCSGVRFLMVHPKLFSTPLGAFKYDVEERVYGIWDTRHKYVYKLVDLLRNTNALNIEMNKVDVFKDMSHQNNFHFSADINGQHEYSLNLDVSDVSKVKAIYLNDSVVFPYDSRQLPWAAKDLGAILRVHLPNIQEVNTLKISFVDRNVVFNDEISVDKIRFNCH